MTLRIQWTDVWHYLASLGHHLFLLLRYSCRGVCHEHRACADFYTICPSHLINVKAMPQTSLSVAFSFHF